MIYHISEEKIFMEIMEEKEVKIIANIIGPQGKNGKNGGKTIIRVPVGTLIY